jgi:isoquinoline 1-oxidoreductase alpha subunit
MATVIIVNGERIPVDVEQQMPLLWVLRDLLGLTGTKYGCGIGVCGSCTVHLDGEAARACQVTAGDVGAREVTTIEGLTGRVGDALRSAWVAQSVVQCGYCQAGQIMTAAAELARGTDGSAVADALNGVLCRCGTYRRIAAAVAQATDELV